MLKRLIPVFVLVALLAPLSAQEKLDPSINDKIRTEANEHSQIMRALHFLTDVYGPRLTGTPSLQAAGEWAIKEMASWGFTNGHLEPWNFGHPGWVNEHLEVHIVAPVKDALVVEALSWTPGTNGTVTAAAFNLIPPEGPLAPPATDAAAGRGNAAGGGAGGRGPQRLGPTPEELTAYLDSVKDKVRGAVVLVGKSVFVPVNPSPASGRMTDEQAARRYDPNAQDQFGQRGGGGDRGTPDPTRLTTQQVNRRIDEFLVASGARGRVNDAGRPHGQIIAFSNNTYDLAKAVPTVVMRNEDYGRIARILADGTPVQLEMNIVNKTFPEGVTAYNTIAEIPGSDKKDEVVMLGGHLDSWHSATGATDNAIGCATMMESARILKAIGVKPRRTIRVALWSGEEQGLLGSQAYVKEHFGSFEAPKPEFAKFAGYLNIDSGTGRARGAGVFGPPEGADILRQVLAPFKDLGVMGASATRSRNVGGTDSTSFNNAGLPGIGFGQDSIEYGSHTHHTSLDTYERIIEADVKSSAIAIAATLYQLAMRDEMLPRFTKDTMPAPPPPRAGGSQ